MAKKSNEWYQDNKASHIQHVAENKKADKDRARRYILDYLSTHPCVDCGESDPIVLEFDHVRGKNKDIARLVMDGYSIDTIQREIDLCQVRCRNCHARKTAKERGFFKSK